MCPNDTVCTYLSSDTQYRESGVMRPVRGYCSDFPLGAGSSELGADVVSLYCDPSLPQALSKPRDPQGVNYRRTQSGTLPRYADVFSTIRKTPCFRPGLT